MSSCQVDGIGGHPALLRYGAAGVLSCQNLCVAHEKDTWK